MPIRLRTIKTRRYVCEVNRPRWDNIRACARLLERLGLTVQVLAHKTSLVINRPSSMSWADFTATLNRALDPRCGSMLLFSQSTGNVFRCNNRGNRPGRFLSV